MIAASLKLQRRDGLAQGIEDFRDHMIAPSLKPRKRAFFFHNINVPDDISEQRLISSALLTLDKQIFELEHYLRKCKAIKQGLMRDRLTGRVRIKTAGVSS